MIKHIEASLREAALALAALQDDKAMIKKIAEAAQVLCECFNQGGRVFSCGNGGSLCDAIHFAEELSGRYRNDRRPLGAMAISDAAHITCTSNDYGYDHIYSRFIEGNARRGDVLLAITTSGKSSNILKAAEKARDIGMRTIGLTGKPGSEFEKMVDVVICTPGGQFADRVQEMHIKVIHILIEMVERTLFNEKYK